MTVGPGHTLAGKYRIISMLGQGGMGSVWRAEHLALRSPVAVKLIDPTLTMNPEACERFLREAQSAATLRSPHVVQILDYGVDEGLPYIVMELLEGESLSDRLQHAGRLSPADTLRIMVDVSRAMGRAHQAGIVHRDLKPDNIFLVTNDESEIAKVLDFGIAKSAMPGMSLGSGTRTGTMLGTPYYMSPEQACGAKNVDYRTDLWALGIIVFECMTGVRPFNADTLGGLVLAICKDDIPRPSSMAQVPGGFDEWFARAAERSPEQRFQSAKELVQTLSAVCGGEAARAPFGPNTPNPWAAQSAQVSVPRPTHDTQVAQAQTSRTALTPHHLVTTTGAGSMSTSGVGHSQHRGPGAALVLAALALGATVVIGGVVGYKVLSSKPAAVPSVAGAPSAVAPPALAASSLPIAAPTAASMAPSVSPVPSASALAVDAATANETTRSRSGGHGRGLPVLPRTAADPRNPPKPEQGASATPGAARAPGPSNSPNIPKPPATNPDPLGI
jgi:eukaryotic-like serine/threonine-protein kinase